MAIVRLWFVCMFVCAWAVSVDAVTRVVSPTGSGDCSAGNPCSFTTAKNASGPGDIIQMRGGTYTMRVFWYEGPSGAPGNHIIVENFLGETPFWQSPSDQDGILNIWRSHYLTFRGIIFDGVNGINALCTDPGKLDPISSQCNPPPTGTGGLVKVDCDSFGSTAGCASNITFENNEIRNFMQGVYLDLPGPSQNNIIIRNNYIHHIGMAANHCTVYMESTGNLIENNTFEAISGTAMCNYNSFGFFSSGGNTVRNNTFKRTGIYWRSGSQGAVGTTNNRAPAITVNRNNGTRVYNNVIIDHGGGGINASELAENCLIYHNTIVGNLALPTSDLQQRAYNAGVGFSSHGGGAQNCQAYNNLVWQPGVTNPPPILNASGSHQSSNNQCSSASESTSYCATIGDPQFVNLAGGGFQLLAGSPAIGGGTGATLSVVPTDIEGATRSNPPSIGAYEGADSGNVYTITRNLATVQAGQNITASWSTTPGPAQAKDWIALQVAGRAPAPYDFIENDGAGNQAWRYVGDGVTTAPLTGNFTVAAPLQEGSYRFWYCLNNGFTCPVSTDIFTVGTPPFAGGFVVTRAAWHPANVPLGTRWIEGIGGMASVRPGGTLRYVASIACVGCDVPTPVTDFFPPQCQVGVGGVWARLPSCGVNPDDVTLAWDASASPEVIGYNLYRCSSGATCEPVLLRDVGNVLTTVDENLSPGFYRWAVTGYDQFGNESPPSNIAEATILAEAAMCIGTDTEVSMGQVSTKRLPLEPGFTGINGVVVAAPINQSFTVSPVNNQQFDMEYVIKFDKTIGLQNVRCRPVRSNNMELDNVLSNPPAVVSTGKTRLFGRIGGGTFR